MRGFSPLTFTHRHAYAQFAHILQAIFDTVVHEYQTTLWSQDQQSPSHARTQRVESIINMLYTSYTRGTLNRATLAKNMGNFTFTFPVLNVQQRWFQHGPFAFVTLSAMPSEAQTSNEEAELSAATRNKRAPEYRPHVYHLGVKQLLFLKKLLRNNAEDTPVWGGGADTDEHSQTTQKPRPKTPETPSVRVLVLMCELPVVGTCRGRRCDEGDLKALLRILFEWKAAQHQVRRFVFLSYSGGNGYVPGMDAPTETHIFDARMGLWDVQLTLPAILPKAVRPSDVEEQRGSVPNADGGAHVLLLLPLFRSVQLALSAHPAPPFNHHHTLNSRRCHERGQREEFVGPTHPTTRGSRTRCGRL